MSPIPGCRPPVPHFAGILTGRMNNETPSRAGWRLARENPKLVLVEVIWRWSFGLAALLLLLQAIASILHRVTISDADWAALHNLDLHETPNAVAKILYLSWKVFCLVLAVLLPAMAVLWIAAATWGRAATLKILQKRSNTTAVAGLTLLRVLLFLFTMIVAVLTVVGADMLATRPPYNPEEPDLLLYLAIVLIALPLIIIVWSILNWVLSLAPLFAVQEQKGTFASLAATFRSLRANARAYWSISGVYGTARGAALLAVIVLGVFLGILGNNTIILALLIALMLAYFVLADFLYVARLAAYLKIIEQNSSPVAKP